MPNDAMHSIVGGFSGLAVAILDKDDSGYSNHNPLSAIGIGTVFGKLPDILEPSLKNPHHRQFFHSLIMFGLIGYGTKKVYDWEPQNIIESVVRGIALCAGIGYLSHLLLDATTSHSIPMLGKI